jgi:hypothetical protein
MPIRTQDELSAPLFLEGGVPAAEQLLGGVRRIELVVECLPPRSAREEVREPTMPDSPARAETRVLLSAPEHQVVRSRRAAGHVVKAADCHLPIW